MKPLSAGMSRETHTLQADSQTWQAIIKAASIEDFDTAGRIQRALTRATGPAAARRVELSRADAQLALRVAPED